MQAKVTNWKTCEFSLEKKKKTIQLPLERTFHRMHNCKALRVEKRRKEGLGVDTVTGNEARIKVYQLSKIMLGVKFATAVPADVGNWIEGHTS